MLFFQTRGKHSMERRRPVLDKGGGHSPRCSARVSTGPAGRVGRSGTKPWAAGPRAPPACAGPLEKSTGDGSVGVTPKGRLAPGPRLGELANAPPDVPCPSPGGPRPRADPHFFVTPPRPKAPQLYLRRPDDCPCRPAPRRTLQWPAANKRKKKYKKKEPFPPFRFGCCEVARVRPRKILSPWDPREAVAALALPRCQVSRSHRAMFPGACGWPEWPMREVGRGERSPAPLLPTRTEPGWIAAIRASSGRNRRLGPPPG